MPMSQVLLLDDDDDLREIAADLLSLAGVECVGLPSYSALVALGERALEAQLAILDINLGPGTESGLDAYAWLRKHKFSRKIVFLTGHARLNALVREAHRLGDVRVIEKPISPEALVNLALEAP